MTFILGRKETVRDDDVAVQRVAAIEAALQLMLEGDDQPYIS
ncbi:MAG: hypothetical protein ACE5KM_04125 [Planctomycetaceae bacterium]